MNKRAGLIAKTRDAKREKSLPIRCKSNISQSTNSPIDHILSLQKTIGNQAVQTLFKSGVIQAKLKIGHPNDRYEQEADRVADEVMRMSEPPLQRQAEEEEEVEELIQTKPLAEQITPLVQRQVEEEEEEILQAKESLDQTQEATPDLESRIHALKGGGCPLPESVLALFEPRFGHDFSDVRVHTDAKADDAAKSLNAKAFTVGTDVVFGSGQYSPETSTGKRLLAHELTHVVQQTVEEVWHWLTVGQRKAQRKQERVREAQVVMQSEQLQPYQTTDQRLVNRLKQEETVQLEARAPAPEAASPTSSLATEIVQGKEDFRLVFYQVCDTGTTAYKQSFQRNAELLAASIRAPKIPPSCPEDVSKLRLEIGAMGFCLRILPDVIRAFLCLKKTKIKELHIFGHTNTGLQFTGGAPGQVDNDIALLKDYVTSDVQEFRLFYHGCFVANAYHRAMKAGLKALLDQLGPHAKVYAHSGMGIRPVDFYRVTLPEGRDELEYQFVRWVSVILPPSYIRDWVMETPMDKLVVSIDAPQLTNDVRRIVVEDAFPHRMAGASLQQLLDTLRLLGMLIQEDLKADLKKITTEILYFRMKETMLPKWLGMPSVPFPRHRRRQL